MSISIEQYRACIGLHNCIRISSGGSLSVSIHFQVMYYFLSIVDNILKNLSAVGFCAKFILVFICMFNFIFDMAKNDKNSTDDHTTIHDIKGFKPLLYIQYYNSRIWFSCLVYCVSYIMKHSACTISRRGFQQCIKLVYKRLFKKKSKISGSINIYTIWLVSLNLILIFLTVPNIINPGPINDLNVVYHNADGFVNLQNKSPFPILYTSKIADFHGYIFSEKPDVVILNETWLKKPILDSEIFPNKSYKVFRRDRSNFSHPPDEKDPKKFKRLGGGVVIAFRSDLDVTTTEYKITRGGIAKAEILSVVVGSKSAGKLCFSTLYRVGTLGTENLAEVKRHLMSISKSKSIHKHILLGDFNLSKTSWPDAQSTCGLEQSFIEMFNDLGFEQMINEPTHIAGNTLDLLLCNQPNIIHDIQILARNSICNSPHYGIKFKVKINCKRLKSRKRRVYNFKKADFKNIKNELSRLPWDSIFSDNDDIDTLLSKFETIFSPYVIDTFQK